MNKIIKKTIVALLSLSMIFTPVVMADEEKNCHIESELDFFPIADTRGHSVMIKKEITTQCEIKTTKEGECLKREAETTTYDTNSSKGEFITEDYSGTIGNLVGAMGAMSELDKLFSGWHGYCVYGMDKDFSWMEDPYMWAGMAMSLGGGAYLDSLAQAGAVQASVAAGVTSVNTMVTLAQISMCMARSAIDIASTIDDYFSDDEFGCDPVDEFCEEEESSEEGEVMSLDEVQYNDIIEGNPDLIDGIIVLSPELLENTNQNDVLVVRITSMNDMNIDGVDLSELENMKQKLKELIVMVRSAIIAAQMTACIASSGSANTGNSGSQGIITDNGNINAAQAGAMALSFISPVLGVAAQLAVNLVQSFKDIDTCSSADDASAKGTRHEKTQAALTFTGLCHFIQKKCVSKSLIDGSCDLNSKDYCCYDQEITRVLMEQIKAQLGKDWAHCSDLSLRELGYINFKQCSASDMGNGVDGAVVTQDQAIGMIQSGGYSNYYSMAMGEYYQAKNSCVNLKDYFEDLAAELNVQIGDDEIEEMLNL